MVTKGEGMMAADGVSSDVDQNQIDEANSAFWNELCGTQLAQSLGITDDSMESLRRFDAWYMDFYPYLETHIPFQSFSGQKVLEVGLGYGTVAQRIADSGAIYSGLDIAAGPVDMANRRLATTNAEGAAVCGSILDAPFPDAEFDYVVAIGSLHHTGALDRALCEVHRLLKPGGGATVMVYNAASYRQWALSPLKTLRRRWSDPARYVSHNEADERMRGAYDVNAAGAGAPQTEFVTRSELTYLTRDFASCDIVAENIGSESVLRFLPRPIACRLLGPYIGLDLYCRLVK
ncbi:class I SAM-dependent methyltransferase [Pelagibius marinus]|uniref:class I SAM-dependent methyltransferase n=1 Tax=Pelagibius marinus TaxID=2762760 RepID=UPI00187273CF|nr:class I SAM-dependent methyltransferase [Pelagibius marinus]